MTAQTVLTSTVLFFSSTELAALCLKAEDLDGETALVLLQNAHVLPPQTGTYVSEIQVFCTKDGVLLFLRPLPVRAAPLLFSSPLLS